VSARCLRCGRAIEPGQHVLEVLVAVDVRDEVSTGRSDRVMHAVCPADYTRRLN
jgi:hypothetical protein